MPSLNQLCSHLMAKGCTIKVSNHGWSQRCHLLA
jgi:hypothetical protein